MPFFETLKNMTYRWQVPAVFYCINCTAFLISLFSKTQLIRELGIVAYSLSLIWLVTSAVFNAYNRMWSKFFNIILGFFFGSVFSMITGIFIVAIIEFASN